MKKKVSLLVEWLEIIKKLKKIFEELKDNFLLQNKFVEKMYYFTYLNFKFSLFSIGERNKSFKEATRK
jgi:hypothetical protein